MNKKVNKRWIGTLVAAVLPVLVLLVLHRTTWYTYSFSEFLEYNYQSGSLGYFLRISILFNIIPFILSNQMGWNKFTVGVFIMTVIYAIPVVILSFAG